MLFTIFRVTLHFNIIFSNYFQKHSIPFILASNLFMQTNLRSPNPYLKDNCPLLYLVYRLLFTNTQGWMTLNTYYGFQTYGSPLHLGLSWFISQMWLGPFRAFWGFVCEWITNSCRGLHLYHTLYRLICSYSRTIIFLNVSKVRTNCAPVVLNFEKEKYFET